MQKQLEGLRLSVSNDRLEAYLYHDSDFHLEEVSVDEIMGILEENHVLFGVDEEAVRLLSENIHSVDFPLVIAIGREAKHGKNGKVIFDHTFSMEIEEHEKVSFRDIIQIPSVKEGERIAVIEPPTKGTPGKNVLGEVLPAKPGKAPVIKAGKNTDYKGAEASFYSTINGKLSYEDRALNVQPLFEVAGDLDLKTGNLDFVGSVVIKGNVPSGYQVKAEGDVQVYGMVEGATICAGGSIHVAEGIAGLGKARIEAGQDVRVGYINQASVEAGGSIFAAHSILHSECVAKGSIYCQHGNIIGGSLSAGALVEAKDIGNRMSTKTEISIGLNRKVAEKQQDTAKQLKKKREEEKKLHKLAEVLREKQETQGLTVKDRITMLRQRNSLEVVEAEISHCLELLSELNASISDLTNAKVQVNGTMYPHVHLGFGKYQYKLLSPHKNVCATILDSEIVIKPKEE
ncbi:FapA family protein [Halobacillus salinarum]|uniref:FapA family protein n=1 Tax=Halobacillus salinarum TaxID=2932257 RepID=A0ABY4ELP9_9BACI|nr:FapA family protein [Halobacillus salinarum]UOQ43031.1 FapA family protein [Halobacillus salinarum]